MNDLISKSALIDALKVHFDSCFREDGELLYNDHICTSDDVVDLIKLVENQPTAYDIDKVVERLELHSFELGTDTLPVHYVRLNEAIEIVKADGKDEKEKINIMGHNSIEEQKQAAKNTNELLNYLIEIIEQNNKRFSFEWAVGGEHATMEIFDNEKEIGYVVNIEPIKYDETGKAINV